MSIPAGFTALEDAIQAWVVSGSGLAADRVVYRGQPAPQPSGAYITIGLLALRRIGQDGARPEANPIPTPGAEILHRATGVRELRLSLQCYAGSPHGVTSAMMRLEGVVSAAALPVRRGALNAAGLGVHEFGPVQSVDGFVGAHAFFEPRAMVEVRCHVASEVVETGTFIEFVEIERLSPSPATTFFVPEEP